MDSFRHIYTHLETKGTIEGEVFRMALPPKKTNDTCISQTSIPRDLDRMHYMLVGRGRLCNTLCNLYSHLFF